MTPTEATGISVEDDETLWNLTRLMVELFGDELTAIGADTAAFLQGYSSLQFPVRMALYANGKISSRFQIIKIRQKSLAAGAFDPPAGYQTLTLLGIIQQGIRGNP